MENTYIDLGYEFWKKDYMFCHGIKAETEALNQYRKMYAEGTVKNVDEYITWVLENNPDMVYNYVDEERRYREENEPKIREYFAKHLDGKTWSQIDPHDWEWYSDWHKDVFGFRPRTVSCGYHTECGFV